MIRYLLRVAVEAALAVVALTEMLLWADTVLQWIG
jgi:hypothetical protein